jgi:hypothetical protein
MTEASISPLRRRMIEDMAVRNFAEKTRNARPQANDNFREART